MPFSATTRNRLLLVLLWIIFYASFTLFLPPLLDDADSVHAEVAREMVQRHDWVTLYANGIRYLEKAPILYWSMALSFKLFGVSTAAARLPIALTVLALVWILESFARRAFNSARAGLYAGLITLSSFGIFIFTRITIPDADVCLWLTLALLAFWATEQPGSSTTADEPRGPTSIRPRITLPTPDNAFPLRKQAASHGILVPQPYPRPTLEGPPEPLATEPLPAGFDYANWDRTATRVYAADEPAKAPPEAAATRIPPHRVQFMPCFLFAAACALNVLTKGLIGIVFPIGIVLLYLAITRGPVGAIRRLGRLHPWKSLVVFLVIAAPWHILIGLANPTQGHPAPITHFDGHWQVPLPTEGNVHGWFWFYFINEHLLRYLNLRVPRDYDTVPLALFWGLVLVWLMPWSAYLLHAIARVPLWKALRRIPWRTINPEQPILPPSPEDIALLSRADHTFADQAVEASAAIEPRRSISRLTPRQKTRLLLGLWAATPLLFFSLSTRQEYYVLPALPALILLIASWLADSTLWNNTAEIPSRETRTITGTLLTTGETKLTRVARAGVAATRISTALFALGTILALALCFFLLHSARPAPTTDLATLLQQNPGDYALSMGHFLDLNAQALGLFRLPLALTAATLFFGTLANWLLRRRGRPHAANLALAAATFVFLLTAHLGLQTFSPVLSSEKLAEAIAPQIHPEDLIVLHGEYEAGSTLGFYLRRNDLHLCEGRSSNLWYGSFFPDAPKIFETRESLTGKWSGPQRIFLWQDPSDKDRPVLELAPVYVIATSGGKQILSNQPNR